MAFTWLHMASWFGPVCGDIKMDFRTREFLLFFFASFFLHEKKVGCF